MADPTLSRSLARSSVIEAHNLVKPHVHFTPVLTNKTLTNLASTPRRPEDLRKTRWEGLTPARPTLRLWFKCNHAQALALAAKELGMPAHIVMPDISPANKIAGARGYGAHVTFSGSTSTERETVADRIRLETGARLVPPYDHPDIILGQGTLGLEFQQQVRDLLGAGYSTEHPTFDSTGQAPASAGCEAGLDAIIAPCGGGGMLSGVALSCEGTGIQVFGAEPEFEGGDDGKRGFETGARIETVNTLSIADGLRTPVGKIPWSVIYERRLVKGMYSVTEDEIKAALKLVLERFKLVIEPSAAVPLAVVLFNEEFRAMVEREAGARGWNLGIVFSGGNMAIDGLMKIFSA
ncbi:pyridoxal-phosphate dependent enzyme [Colletotrichum acutatum]